MSRAPGGVGVGLLAKRHAPTRLRISMLLEVWGVQVVWVAGVRRPRGQYGLVTGGAMRLGGEMVWFNDVFRLGEVGGGGACWGGQDCPVGRWE